MNSAHAYLDPGTGTMLLQGIIAAVGGAGAVILARFNRIRAFLRSRSSAKATTAAGEDSANGAKREPGAD